MYEIKYYGTWHHSLAVLTHDLNLFQTLNNSTWKILLTHVTSTILHISGTLFFTKRMVSYLSSSLSSQQRQTNAGWSPLSLEEWILFRCFPYLQCLSTWTRAVNYLHFEELMELELSMARLFLTNLIRELETEPQIYPRSHCHQASPGLITTL